MYKSPFHAATWRTAAAFLAIFVSGRHAATAIDSPPNIVFLQADILDLPFQPQSFSTVVSMSVLHVLKDGRAMLGELARVWDRDGGNLAVTSLVLGRAIGDRYLRFLRKKEGVRIHGRPVRWWTSSPKWASPPITTCAAT